MNYGKTAVSHRRGKVDATSTKVRKKFGVTMWKILLTLVLVISFVGISSALGIVKGIISTAPDISYLDVTPTGYSTTVLSDDGQEIATLVASGANRKYVTIDEIPEDLQNAFVAVEDSRFYEHNGIDPYGIVRAFVHGITSGRFDQGASTITQQLIKNNVLTDWVGETHLLEKFQRKFQEQYLAIELEKQVNDKKWILENYMNSINLGQNTLGVQAAANRYFGKDVSELNLSECACIAGITKNPYGYNPISFPEENDKRRLKVLGDMLEQGYITEAEYDEAVADDVYSRIASYNDSQESSPNSYFVDALIDQVYDDLVNELGWSETEASKVLFQGGLTIYSTQNLDMQAICDEEANNIDNYAVDTKYSFSLSFTVKKADGSFKYYSDQTMLAYYKDKKNNSDFSINYSSPEACYEAIAQYEQDVLEEGDSIVEDSEQIYITLQPQVAMTVMDNATGEVKAIVGGRGDKIGNRTFNRATDMKRQPGSTFKIVGCYAAALDAGDKTLADVEYNSSYTVGQKTYKNSTRDFTGYTTIREAIIDSINIVAIKTMEDIGVDLAYDYALDFGFTTLYESDKNLGFSLGGLSYGVKNVELTAAYATIANEGVYNEPIYYTKILDHDGNVLIDKTAIQDKHTVIKDTTAWLLTDAMQDVMTSGTGRKAYFGTKMAQAGKSGTTTSNRDCLFAGYTPYYTLVVWGGYDDNSKQAGGSTTQYPKVLWKSIMSRLHEDLEPKSFSRPSGITSAKVCKKSGLLPLEDVCSEDPRGSMVYTEYFEKGTRPKDECDRHIAVEVCPESELLPTEFCPLDELVTKVFIIPDEYALNKKSGKTDDTEYLLTEEWLELLCDIHTEEPEEPEEPEDPEDPEDPEVPEDPEDPEEPEEPEEPIDPLDPTDPIDPVGPIDPVEPENVLPWILELREWFANLF